jgi:hypothetical protein
MSDQLRAPADLCPGTLVFEEVICLSQILPFVCYKMLYGGLYNIVIGFMEAQVNTVDGSRWGPESLFKKYYPSGVLTVVSDAVVEKVRIQLYYSLRHILYYLSWYGCNWK